VHQRANASLEGSSSTGIIPTIGSLLVDKLLTIRKSSSTSSLQDLDIASSYSLPVATSKWNVLPETFALPNFDGFCKPIASWRNKSVSTSLCSWSHGVLQCRGFIANKK
jgi:hypothetical protein